MGIAFSKSITGKSLLHLLLNKAITRMKQSQVITSPLRVVLITVSQQHVAWSVPVVWHPSVLADHIAVAILLPVKSIGTEPRQNV